ncbi:hypothetical protein PISL3812_04852 [Talaromyces islandicus]|uniref:Uncharacterized protein n=1 Tax=Talaromyces islandicus TaxID=28573 RepID=A0A0U1LYL6_TALIS|nr:hypothetical protein PISL3812_04852 [Talaromyces islandicus]
MAARIPRLAKFLSLPTKSPQNLIQSSLKRHNQDFLRKQRLSSISALPRAKIPHRSYSSRPSSKATPKSPENATENNNNKDDDMPDVLAGLKSIKMSRTTKAVVYTALTIMATVESVFWIKVLWAKFAPAQKDLDDGEN